MDTRFKVPRDEVAVMETSDKSGRVIHVKLRFKKDVELRFKKSAEDNSMMETPMTQRNSEVMYIKIKSCSPSSSVV